MPDEINVHVVKFPGRRNWYMRYVDPGTGKQVPRSAGTPVKSEAQKAAAKWESELREGRYQKTSRMPWAEFRDQYERATSPNLREKTLKAYDESLSLFERFCGPSCVADLTTARVTAFVAKLREPRKRTARNGKEMGEYNLSEASIARHLRHLKAVARWANRQGILPKVPAFDMPKRAKANRMKGRPITAEEFERMLAATETVVGAKAAESWRALLRGLWTTGLRLGEALALRWDHQPGGVSVDLDGRRSVLVFDADAQKSGKDELVPLTPEAVEFLAPIRRPDGFVFVPLAMRGGVPMSRDPEKIGKVVSRIGKQAKVVTEPEKGRTATAHDLRRSFGARWAKRVMPPVLMAIMRHADIGTTMTFYARENARTTAAESGSALGSAPPKRRRPAPKNPVK